MIKHLPGLDRPETEIELLIREIEPRSPDEEFRHLQVPGFRHADDPRIPAGLRLAAMQRAYQKKQQRRGRRDR